MKAIKVGNQGSIHLPAQTQKKIKHKLITKLKLNQIIKKKKK